MMIGMAIYYHSMYRGNGQDPLLCSVTAHTPPLSKLQDLQSSTLGAGKTSGMGSNRWISALVFWAGLGEGRSKNLS